MRVGLRKVIKGDVGGEREGRKAMPTILDHPHCPSFLTFPNLLHSTCLTLPQPSFSTFLHATTPPIPLTSPNAFLPNLLHSTTPSRQEQAYVRHCVCTIIPSIAVIMAVLGVKTSGR